MVKIVLTPDWFLGKDVFIEFFSFIVLIIFSILAIRSYKMNKNRNFLYLGWGFGLIALAQLAAVITKLVLYYDIGPTQAIGNAIITSQILSSVDIFYYAGFFFQRFLTLCGLYIIYRLPRKHKSVGDYFLVLYFILLSAIVGSSFYYLYYLTSLILLILIIGNYYEIYKENRFVNTKILIIAFSMLALSQLIFVLSTIDALFVLASAIELISYVGLLFLVIKILKHGKKKGPHGYNIRYAGNNTREKRKH